MQMNPELQAYFTEATLETMNEKRVVLESDKQLEAFMLANHVEIGAKVQDKLEQFKHNLFKNWDAVTREVGDRVYNEIRRG